MVKIEYSKDLNKAKIANISIGLDNRKIVRLYEHSEDDKYKVNDNIGTDEEILENMKKDKCLAELVFYHNESIESLIKVLEGLKNKDFIKEEENPEMYKKIEEVLKED